MSEARKVLAKVAADLEARYNQASVSSNPHVQHHGLSMLAVSASIRLALATQPEPGAVPELPEWVEETVSGHWHIYLSDRSYQWLPGGILPDDLERIAEACRILAARERARRAQS